LGSVIHQLLEEAGRSAFTVGDIVGIEKRWEELVHATEAGMRTNWLERHLVPLSDSVTGYEVRRVQATERGLELAETVASHESLMDLETLKTASLFGCEFPVSSADGLVRGRIDAVLPSKHGPVLRDYKSGAVFEFGLGRKAVLKETYKIQVRIYSGLYFHTTAVWPSKLEIVPVLGPPQEVSFDPITCLQLVDEARALLKDINQVIIASAGSPSLLQEHLSKPDSSTCLFCSYRPGCALYLKSARSAAGWPQDISGTVERIAELRNKRLMLMVKDAKRMLTVRGITPPPRHPALEKASQGDEISLYNLRAAGSASTFTESPLTVIYNQSSREFAGCVADQPKTSGNSGGY
jgi:hypothetical protein